MKAIAVCTLAVLAALAAAVEPARACSCIPPDPWAALAQADGVLVGTVLERREAGGGVVLVLSVERRLKGPLGRRVEVRTAQNGSVCGVEADVGQRVGLALYRDGGAWRGNMCWQFEPAQLLVVAALPPPTGRGPAALLVGGRFGPARMLALDARGRTLAYGIGPGSAEAFSVCPGGNRVAEAVAREGGRVVAVRELPSLRLLWERRLKGFAGVTTPHCLDTLGNRLGVFVSDPDANGRLLRVTAQRIATTWRGPAFYAAFRGRNAYVQLLGRNTALVVVDIRTGARRLLGTIRVNGAYQLAFNRAGTHLAGESFTEGVGNPRLVVVDLSRRPVSARTTPRPVKFGSAHWLGNERVAYFGGNGEILVYDTRLKLRSRSRGWQAGIPALVGRTAFGIRRGTVLVAARLPRGSERVVRRLPGRYDPNTFRVIIAAR